MASIVGLEVPMDSCILSHTLHIMIMYTATQSVLRACKRPDENQTIL